ncbi:hypothetical protein [Alienimonas chondri]|uniref:hypothetical protein n=1 Tax=Alienimonas chondri TaxID=2681879 RepID=UPI0014898B63|nr:hypothetical protein [Alienimonas chondri]
MARGTEGDESDADPIGSPVDDPWEAVAIAAVRTALRAVRAADDGWAAKLANVAADPGVREALGELADAARHAAWPDGAEPNVVGEEDAVSGSEDPSASSPPSAEARSTPRSSQSSRPATPSIASPPAASSPPASSSAASEPSFVQAEAAPGTTATLGEIRERLTLGADASASGADSAVDLTGAAGLEGASTLQSEDVRGLCRVPDRCRTKAQALRWAADRLVAGAETGPLRARREELEAIADPGEALWPLLEPAPPGAAPADYERTAAVFEVLADAAVLLDSALERYLSAAGDEACSPYRSEELERLKAALDLTAEAQSMALIAVRNLREKPDRDQVAVYKTIRDISDARTGIAYFIRNYLREGSHADPTDHGDLASRIGGASAARSRGKAEREAFKKFAHAAAKTAEHADDEEPDRFDYHADRLAKFAHRLLGLGVPPSDVRFRESVPEDPAALRAAMQRLVEAEQSPPEPADDAAGNDAAGDDAPGEDVTGEGAANQKSANDEGRGESVATARAAALGRILDYLPDPAAATGDDPGENEEEDAPATSQYADSVDAALSRAAEEYPQALAFAFNSKSVREGYPYRHPDRVYLGLKFLATTLRDALAGREPCADLDEECLRQCGLHYSPNQSASTMGQFPEDYRTVWGGEEVPLTRHLRGGNNKDPRLSVRLAFHYDRAADTVVIGYLGQHQRTRST